MASSTNDFGVLASAAVKELAEIVSGVSGADIAALVAALRGARRVACHGVGREGLAMKAFAMRLFHLGLQASVVGEMTCVALGLNDLLLVSAGPGYFSTVAALCGEARQAGASVLAITAQHSAPLPFADLIVRIPAQTLPPSIATPSPAEAYAGATTGNAGASGAGSVLQMGSCYELALHLALDCASRMLQQEMGLSDADMKARHTNLE